MDKKIIIILGIIVVIAAVLAAFMFSSFGEDTASSQLDILGGGSIPENGTLNVKLSNGDGVALKDKEVHVVVKNSKGKVVFDKSSKTYVNGVANVKIENVSPGKYDVNVTFDGDENYTACSIAEKLIIAKGAVEEDTDDDTDDASAAADDTSSSSQSQSSSSYSSRQYSPSSQPSSDSDDGSDDTYYDEDGHEMEPVIDENGEPETEDFSE